jgi:hypothetical protein
LQVLIIMPCGVNREQGKGTFMLRREVEEASFDDLAVSMAEGSVTRGRAIKLAGAALLGSALTMFWPEEADARRNNKKRRRRRRRKQERRFRNRCEAKGRVVCKVGNKLACCPSTVVCTRPLDPLCNVL